MWEFDTEALRKASNTLDVRYKIKYRKQKNLLHLGQHTWINDYHLITIRRDLKPKDASMTIWHELTHAAQLERYGMDLFDQIYEIDIQRIEQRGKRLKRTRAYETIPFEAEAYANERYYKRIILVKSL